MRRLAHNFAGSMLGAAPVRRATLCLALAALALVSFGAAAIADSQAKSVAFLGVQFLNDHEDLEPTTDAERARLTSLAALFKAKLEASGRFQFAPIPSDAAAKIASGPVIGNCGGCEYQYGAELRDDLVAWIVVQKVSNLILNLNVYMGDVGAGKLTFVHSVDIRGNTDESWSRGLSYLLRNRLHPSEWSLPSACERRCP